MIDVREIKTIEQLEQVQQLEYNVWGMPPIPIHQTLTAVKNGGVVVGAYDGDQLVGFSYGFSGFREGKSYLCSHMLGIDENYRSQGIGEKLKYAQQAIAIERGYDLMVWTFDPLETRNGFLNLSKLNGICYTYIENCYGEMQDGLNKGLPSDRFEVSWHITSNYVGKKVSIDATNVIPVASYVLNEQGFPRLELTENLKYNEDFYTLPVPKDFQVLKAQDPALALDWRFKTRHILQRLFAQGYAAVQLQQRENYNEYVLAKLETLGLGGAN
ncbi:GNAT family N-acetyltransferase [Lysinibacillus agricola]|uniref:GNAT family N-acetyltransferase n=1 Tax=Lysinibacillus agricola TaxID=2590012 RepID=A0ABX7ASR1_9BACI|nr:MULTISPECIES: GNAT family N-acetyltransferase [Lysinibacillus]KOS59761.1 GCN5 family acetyltransferase [Lysinibacillus sp. FJAT-14222]QQP12987.1 GNAT family N-acetyltransferase [Lysinibacillus agricola]